MEEKQRKIQLKTKEIEINDALKTSVYFYAVGKNIIWADLFVNYHHVDTVVLNARIDRQLMPFISGQPLHTWLLYPPKVKIVLYYLGNTDVSVEVESAPDNKQITDNTKVHLDFYTKGTKNKLIYSDGTVVPFVVD